MRLGTKLSAGAVGLAVATGVALATYTSRHTDRVEYETVLSLDGAELRRYPATMLVATTAPTSRTAFSRLFAYISGENEEDREMAMTAPVRTEGTEVPMTAPVRVRRDASDPVAASVRTDDSEDSVTMAFYLPTEYGPDTAPVPINPEVELVTEAPRTLAVQSFSWWPTDGRVAEQERRLLAALDDHGVEPTGAPFFLGYDAPGTLPFLRTNEIAVPVREA